MTLQIKVKSGNSLTIQPSSNFRIAVVAAVAAVVVAILTWVLKKELLLTDGNGSDYFGKSVALDGNRALVGAPGRNGPNGSSQGTAYIFDLSGGVWSEPTDISLGNGGNEFDNFGNSVALDGDRALVGAPGRNGPNGSSQGAAYIFDLSGGIWSDPKEISLGTDGSGSDNFGYSVALDGNRALVGAPYRDGPNGYNHGAAYIFDLSGGTWSKTTDISLENGGNDFDFFGNSVALDGSRALVGARGLNQGAAYIFDLSGGTWSEPKEISLGEGGNEFDNDQFGFSVALDGNRALVGEPYRGDDQGAAYIFDLSGGTWSKTTDISLGSDASSGDQFGFSVALDGNRALVGATGRLGPNDNFLQGAAYIFDLSGGTWSEPKEISLGGGGSSGDLLGSSVSLDGDRALVGANGYGPNDNFFQGAAYIYDYERTN